MENFIGANLRIITPEHSLLESSEDCPAPLEIKAQLYMFLRQRVICQMTYWQLHNPYLQIQSK